MPVTELLNQNDFPNALKAATADQQFVLVDFFAKWCGPCRRIAPKLEEFSASYSKVKFLKVDVDKCPELASKFSISAMPTFLFFRCGSDNVVDTIVGANTDKIKILLDHISSAPAEVEVSSEDENLGDEDSQEDGDSTCSCSGSSDNMPQLMDDSSTDHIEPSLDL